MSWSLPVPAAARFVLVILPRSPTASTSTRPRFLFNGQPAAILDITKTEAEDTLEVIDAVNAFLDQERQYAPPGIVMAVTNDVSSIVRDRLALLTRNGATGLALVLLVLWMFFGFRYAFWVAAGLPVSFLGAVVLMVAAGYTINMLTMVGLLIVIGLLMDDAIVIAENVATKRQQVSRRWKRRLRARDKSYRAYSPPSQRQLASSARWLF